VLYALLPGIEENTEAFFLLCLFCLFLSSISTIWMISMVTEARFGGLPSEKRKWLVTVNSTLERILALISTGMPPDLAWRKSIEELALTDRTLAQAWKAQVWDPDFSISSTIHNESERLMIGMGIEVRKTIQTSLIEGRACLDRLDSIHRAFLTDLKMKIGKELALLPNRCLKPLFIFVLPSVMILMIGSFAISFQGFFSS
jgi:hypothetical protein